MKKNIIFISIILLILFNMGFLNSTMAMTQTSVLCEMLPIKNSMVSSQSPNNNYSTTIYLFSGESNASSNVVRSAISFDFSSCGITENTNILSVKFGLYQYSELSSNVSNLKLYSIEDSVWNQESLNWNNQPIFNLEISTREFQANEPNGLKYFFIDSNIIKQNTSNKISFILKSENEVNDLYNFYSSRISNDNHKPKLIIEISTEENNVGTPTPTIFEYVPYYPSSENVVPENLRGNLSLYALMGQSNMSGRGVIPSSQILGLVYNFQNNYKWGVAIEPVDSPHQQLDIVSSDPPNAGYSPSLFFGLNMNEPVGLIPCAKGGSSIKDWQFSYGDDTLFGSCWKRILSASQMGELKGILFFQGESESKNYDEALLWKSRFEQFVESIRNIYGDVPIVFAQIGNIQSSTFPYADIVQTQQESVELFCVKMIKTDDLPVFNGHFNTLGYQEIGIRFSEAMKTIEC